MALSRVVSTSPTVTTPVTIAKIFRGSPARAIANVTSAGLLNPEVTFALGGGATVPFVPGAGSWVNGFLVGNPFTTPLVEPTLPDALLLMDM
jgi:hypothetical protein